VVGEPHSAKAGSRITNGERRPGVPTRPSGLAVSAALVEILRGDPRDRLWRAATLMLKRYGDRALEESVSRAEELASAGDDNGVAVWRRISEAVGQLINTTPPGAVH
jgi:hypothetical protein